jgi:hypothetical protein
MFLSTSNLLGINVVMLFVSSFLIHVILFPEFTGLEMRIRMSAEKY